MPDYIIKGETLTDIADAVREMNGESAEYTPAEMPDAIRAAQDEIAAIVDEINGEVI